MYIPSAVIIVVALLYLWQHRNDGIIPSNKNWLRDRADYDPVAAEVFREMQPIRFWWWRLTSRSRWTQHGPWDRKMWSGSRWERLKARKR